MGFVLSSFILRGRLSEIAASFRNETAADKVPLLNNPAVPNIRGVG
jgi:hypothetical protein